MAQLSINSDATLAELLMTNMLAQLAQGNRSAIDDWLDDSPELLQGLSTDREWELYSLVDSAVESAAVDANW